MDANPDPSPTGILARCLQGRLDRTVLSDVGVIVGLVLVGRGLLQLSSALAWLFAGTTLVVLSVIAVLPPKIAAPSKPKGDS
jgi:hypothetical protein